MTEDKQESEFLGYCPGGALNLWLNYMPVKELKNLLIGNLRLGRRYLIETGRPH